MPTAVGFYWTKKCRKGLNFSKPFTATFSINQHWCTSQVIFVKNLQTVKIYFDGKWRQVICAYRQGKLNVYINGKQTNGGIVARQLAESNLFVQNVGETTAQHTAISSIAICYYGLNEKACLEKFDFWKRNTSASQSKEFFVTKPASLTSEMIYMVSNKPEFTGNQSGISFSSQMISNRNG